MTTADAIPNDPAVPPDPRWDATLLTVRSVRVLATWLVPLAALGAVVLGAALPVGGARPALALGLGAGALVRLAFGTAAGVPPAAQVRAALAALGVEVRDLAPSRRQRIGSAEYVGPRRRRAPAQGARARPRRAGHAAARAPLAPARLPRPAAERPGRPARAGRARGARDADGRAGRRPGARGRDRRARARTATRSSSPGSPTSSRSRAPSPDEVERRDAREPLASRSRGSTPRASRTAG